MKRVVFLEDLRESEVRPDKLYTRYKEMLSVELPRFFADRSKLVKVKCPGCDSARATRAFTRFGFQYCRCGRCGSLFVSPRPTDDVLKAFLGKSAAVGFWRNELARKTREARYREQYSPLANWVLQIVDEYLPEARTLLDYGTKYVDFLSIIADSKKFARAVSVSPSPAPEDLPARTTICRDIASVREKVDVFTAFEDLDRAFDPAGFIEQASHTLKKGGVLFLTANTVSGFEYQVLGEHSPRLHPPDRLNLLSIEAIERRLTGAGLEIIELSTPGRLDVEIVRNTLKDSPDIPVPDFFKYVFQSRGETAWHSLQDFLQENRLSSYLRVAARKKP